MDKPPSERGDIGPTDGIKAEGGVGNERYVYKMNLAVIDDIEKKHGLGNTSENSSDKKYALAPRMATKFFRVNRYYVALSKIRRVLR